MSTCGICGRRLEVDADPMSRDCGGDCWGSIGMIEADMGGDPKYNIAVVRVPEEIAKGWREPDGTPKPQSAFL